MSDSPAQSTAAPTEGLLTVVIPALNEEDALPGTLHELVPICRDAGWQIIVVDDGSSDGTPDVTRRWPADVQLFRHKVSRGYGAAIKTGVSRATTRYVVTFDADGQHDPADIPRLLAKAEDAHADLVIGDRGGRASGWYRRLGKWLIRAVARVLLTVPVNDLNSGIKLFRADLGRHYSSFLPPGMPFSDVLTLAFISDKRAVVEIPVSIRKRTGGISTVNTMTALDTVIEILNIITLFNPMRIFLPLSLLAIVAGVLWGAPIVLLGRGVSTGAMLAIVTGVILFALGLLAEQLGAIRKGQSVGVPELE